MNVNKKEIIKKHCFTDLVYDRINKKLSLNLTKEEIDKLVLQVLIDTDIKFFEKNGKNFYVSNHKHNIKLTINSNTFRIITADKIS